MAEVEPAKGEGGGVELDGWADGLVAGGQGCAGRGRCGGVLATSPPICTFVPARPGARRAAEPRPLYRRSPNCVGLEASMGSPSRQGLGLVPVAKLQLPWGGACWIRLALSVRCSVCGEGGGEEESMKV